MYWCFKIYSNAFEQEKSLYITSSGHEITYDNNKYKAGLYIKHSDITLNGNLNEEAITIDLLYDHELFTPKQSIDCSAFNVGIYFVDQENWQLIHDGYIGDIKYFDNYLRLEIIGNKALLNKNIDIYYSPTCRADFGDKQCGSNIDNYKVYGSITESQDNQLTGNHKHFDIEWFANGKIFFTSGEYKDQSYNILRVVRDKIIITSNISPIIGDNYYLVAGCDKKFSSCANKFNNAINFRGEPHIY